MLPDTKWTKGRPNIAPGEGLHQAVARVALLRPDAIALVSGGRRITYADLDRTADAWGALLAETGVGRGDVVPIVLPRGPELILALLAVLKTGAAYALLDPSWPEARVGEVIDLLDARLLISDTANHPALQIWSPPRHPVEPPPTFRPATVAGTDPSNVFFTSGTSGRPKGVLVPHRATLRLFQRNGFARFTATTVMPLAAPVAWDAFSLELWSVLVNGGTSLIIDEPYLSSAALRAGVAGHGVDSVWLTSSLFNMIVDEDPAAFSGLRQVMTGGERLSPRHVGRFLGEHPETALFNGYGPVESVVFATTHRITAQDAARPDGIPLGRPVPGTGVHVLDGGRPCAVGETGEICLSGAGLALGYLGDPALTAEKFADTVIDGEEVRAYRTGDLGAWDEDGLLRFRGRADRQLKIRGHRIEPAEVERRIERLGPVRQARVLARRDDAGTAVDLVAFCVPTEPGDPLEGVPELLESTMAAYQRPAEVRSVDAFPVTAQGKLDERALLAMLTDAPAPGGFRHEDPTVRLVAETFAAVLGRTSVPAGRSFFALGGDSLGAGRVCARLAARSASPVPVSRLYRHPTAAGLAAWLDSACPEPADVRPDAVEVPLTPMQEVFLTRHLLTPDDRTANCLLLWSVEGDLDRAALQAAVEEVHWRHEPLSATYAADPRPAAWLDDVPPPALEELPPQPALDAGIRVLRETLSARLEPAKGEVWRTALVEAGTVTLFGCVVHHIAFDGFSQSILARDLAAAYNGTTSDLPKPPDLAEAWHRSALSRNDVLPQETQLAKEFDGVPDLRWPDAPRQAGTEPGRVEVILSPGILAAVDTLAAAAGRTRFVVLLAHWASALAEVTGQRDFAVGVPVSQRADPALEHAIGCHITTVPLRLRGAALDGDPELIGRIVTRAFTTQEIPLRDILNRLNRPRSARPPLFQAMFAVQDNPVPRLELAGLRTAFLHQPYIDLPLELHTELWPHEDGGLRAEIAYRPEVVPSRVATSLARCFLDRLSAGPRS
ncbi:amino acid adenylation domain-containing protein [Amycolatopsis roodepoortensis]|uniref:amino acid adenylation domain-containing protein n=1 Tax=Amycolatopsis roodepoortensis TaxID=700274 RepID=UPI00214CA72F|nr:amino acid adenylation domain-containing protein [Amycolatopsis roodepoortensis]UUV31595.1 amino acid adenylation domain-containing protein [Amycolatopsis roodepoortensis]